MLESIAFPPPLRRSALKASDIPAVHRLLSADFAASPAPVIDLMGAQGESPFRILLATICSARTKDACTAKVCREKLFPAVSGWDDVRRLSVDEIARLIYPVGFYRQKAEAIKRIPDVLDARFGGRLPHIENHPYFETVAITHDIDVDVAAGNVQFYTGVGGGNGSLNEVVWAYLPYPDDESIDQTKYFSAKGLCKPDQYNLVINGDHRNNYFKMDNLNNSYCYYFHREEVIDKYNPAPEIYKVLFRDAIMSTYNGNLTQLVYGSSKIYSCEGVKASGDVWVLRYRPGVDSKWTLSDSNGGQNDDGWTRPNYSE